MSTRSTTHFVDGGETYAIVYRHSDGYPEGHGVELQEFFAAVEAQTQDTRYNDPSYLAAKLVVWLADKFSNKFTQLPDGEWGYVKSEPLDFLSVGVVMTDPGDIEFLYEVDCGKRDENGRPEVRCYGVNRTSWDDPPTKGRKVKIPVTA